jgi:hypothetical protein
VFAPLFWYILLPGAIGPVLYRAAQFLTERWARGAQGGSMPPADATGSTGSTGSTGVPPGESAAGPGEPYGRFARSAYGWLDWLPVRLSAAGFAVVGNFEDAVYCWRAASAVRGGDEQRRLLLMTGGGALGLRIADARVEAEVRGDAAALDADPSLSGGAPSGFDWAGGSNTTPSDVEAIDRVFALLAQWGV